MQFRLFVVLLSTLLLLPLVAQGQGMRNSPLMQDARTLVQNHTQITRHVEVIDTGVITTTTTKDPELLPVIRRHPRDMYQHLEQGGWVRHWDPLFVELAKHSDKVTMRFEDIKGGIKVTSTSEDAEVAKLIKAHAEKVSQFVQQGPQAAHSATPLPESYTAPSQNTVAQDTGGRRGGCCSARGNAATQGQGRKGRGAQGRGTGCNRNTAESVTPRGTGRGGCCAQANG